MEYFPVYTYALSFFAKLTNFFFSQQYVPNVGFSIFAKEDAETKKLNEEQTAKRAAHNEQVRAYDKLLEGKKKSEQVET